MKQLISGLLLPGPISSAVSAGNECNETTPEDHTDVSSPPSC